MNVPRLPAPRTRPLPDGALTAWAAAMLGTAGLFALAVPARLAVLVRQAERAHGAVPDWLLLGGWFPYAALGLELVFVAGFALIGVIIGLARKGLLFGLTLLTYAVWVTPTLDALPVTGSSRLAVDALQALGLVLATQFFLLFPDGRYMPRWAWVSAPVWTVLSVLWVLDPDATLSLRDPFLAHPAAFVLLMVGGWIVGLVAQWARYRGDHGNQRDDPSRRIPTRLPLVAVAVACAGYGAVYLPSLVLQGGTGRAVYDLVAVPVFWLTALPMVVAFLVALLRDQLFDVRLVLRRTLVYAVLTNVLTVLYATTTIILRLVLDPLAGESAPAVALSTLVVAGGFHPIRRHIQAFVDRRFDRARYDAARVVEEFNANLRHQVNLDQLHADLLATVHQTMQPTTASVWLRGSRR